MGESPSYIDYESFLDPSFSAVSFANNLVLTTNNPSDSPLDLSTPLSRVLFDVQEVDTHIHSLTTKAAIPLLTHTQEKTTASIRIAEEVEGQLKSLTDGYKRLEKDVIDRYETAEEVRRVAERLCQTIVIGRSVTRCLTIGRQLEAQMVEAAIGGASSSSKREDHRALVRASNLIVSLRQIFSESGPGQEGEGLDRVSVMTTLKTKLAIPSEQAVISRSQQIIREFSVTSLPPSTGSTAQGSSTVSSSTSSYMQSEATKARTASALNSLYLLSNAATPFQPHLMIAALNSYLQTALTSSVAALVRALTTLPALERTLNEISARCQNIVALEALLRTMTPPPLPHDISAGAPTARPAQSDSAEAPPSSLVVPLLNHLDTSSLASHFWRSLASFLVPRVQDLSSRSATTARALRSQRERIRDALRECVVRGSGPGSYGATTVSLLDSSAGKAVAGPGAGAGPAAGGGAEGVLENGSGNGTGEAGASRARQWDREVAVLVGAVLGPVGR